MKNFLSVIAGVIVSFVVITLIQLLSAKLYPLPEGLDIKNIEAMKAYIENLPMQPLLLLLLGYALGSYCGGLTAGLISRKLRQAVTVGVILTIANSINLFDIPHPLWLTVVTIVIFIPFAFAGGRTVVSKHHKHEI